MTDDRAKRLAQLRQAYESGILDEETYQATVAALQAQLGARQATVSGPGALAFEGGTAVGEGGIVVGRDVLGSIFHIYQVAPGRSRLSETEFERVLNDYLGWVLREHGRARLHGLQSLQDTGPINRPLSAVYVSLVAQHRPAVMPGDLTRRGRRAGGQEPDEMAGPQPVDMADLLTLGDRVAIVGGAGCGKTTYLSFVAASLAATLAGQPLDARLKVRRPGELLPIPLVAPLRFWKAYRDACAEKRERILDHPDTGTLAGFLRWYLRYRYKNFEASGDFFERLLKGRGCLIMLDGLDEVVSVSERRVVRDGVDRLLDTQYPGNPCLVTAREAGYRDAPFGDDFWLCKVQPMTGEQIAALVEAWCAQIWRQEADRDTAHGELSQAITALNKERAERKQEPLIATPLLVTMVVSVKYSRRELPRERAKLYDACVDVVLESQYTGREDEAGARRAVVDWGGPPDKQREWLSQLAFEMHQRGAAGATAGEDQVRAVLSPLLERRGELPLLQRFIDAVRGRGGLFEERGDRFQFMHLTFQEFLAAQYLARQWAALPDHEKFLAQVVADEWWREALLLTVGSLGAPAPYEQRETFVAALCGLPGSPDVCLAAAELSATGLLDLTEPEPMLLDTARQRLVALLTASSLNQVAPPKRAVAADALARLGDLRPGVGLRPDGLPDIVWCHVPAGPFIMGTREKDIPALLKKYGGERRWYEWETPQHRLSLPGYSISRYPVTNAQYAAFVAAGGYQERRCWTEAGWQWREDRTGPETYGGVFDLPNHPVVGVTWYEAVAFCRWLTEQLRQGGELGGDEEMTLPTESQWEKAARGGLPPAGGGDRGGARIYPWGNAPDPNRANYGDTGIGTTSAVGCFPGGAGSYGVEDLSGNVWEWTRSLYKEYPYDPGDGRENLEAGREVRRVLRGGAFLYEAWNVRCAFRLMDSPDVHWYSSGFRVVASPVHL